MSQGPTQGLPKNEVPIGTIWGFYGGRRAGPGIEAAVPGERRQKRVEMKQLGLGFRV